MPVDPGHLYPLPRFLWDLDHGSSRPESPKLQRLRPPRASRVDQDVDPEVAAAFQDVMKAEMIGGVSLGAVGAPARGARVTATFECGEGQR
jgi:hypothetical protein